MIFNVGSNFVSLFKVSVLFPSSSMGRLEMSNGCWSARAIWSLALLFDTGLIEL